MMATHLSDEEIDLLTTYNKGEWQSIATPETISKYQTMARHTLNKQVNVELSNADFSVIEQLAKQEGFSCKEFIGSILHKYALGQLKEI
jgi:predicted DNA binding CopG/RHH family protein